jgi:protein-tyrosine phosphatase
VSQTQITVVCDQNRARSPLAAALLTRLLGELGVEGVTVGSAGVSATPDLPAMPEVIEAAATLGLDLDTHRSRRLDAGIVAASDLILTMTRAQADAIGVLHDAVHERLFLIGELAGLVGDDGPWQASASLDGPLAQRLGALHLRRGLRGLRDVDDVLDPIGHGPESLHGTVERLDALVLGLRGAFA